jgi:hypothetical protein
MAQMMMTSYGNTRGSERGEYTTSAGKPAVVVAETGSGDAAGALRLALDVTIGGR